MKEKIIDKSKILGIILILTFLISIPYLNFEPITTHDISYHTNRIIAISDELKAGHFPVLIYSNLLDGFGYASPLFYPELFLYIPAILTALGLNFLTSYKLFTMLTTFFTLLFTFYSANHIFKKKNIAWTITILYGTAFYRLADIYERGAIGEVLAIVFLPIIICGLYEIIFGENKKWWIISIALFGIANCHVLTFAMLIPIILLICLLNVDKIFKDKKKLLNLFIAAGVAVVLCIGFFIPMFEQKLNDEFYIDGQTIESSEVVKERSLSLSMMLGSNIKSGYAVDSSTRNDGMSEGIGPILLILAGLILCRKGLNYKENRFEIQLFVLGFFSYFMTTKFFPWEWFKFLNVLQFAFRLNFIPTICFTLVGAHSFYEVVTNKRDSVIILSIVILLISGYVLSSVNLNFNPDIYHSFNVLVDFPNEIGNSEYLPVNTDLEDLELYNINNKEKSIEFTQVGSKIEFEYNEKDLKFEINVPLIYYKGYKANIVDKAGNKTELEVVKNEENAHVLLKSNEKLTGTVTVEYKMTLVQAICYSVTFISLILLSIYIITEYLKNKEIKLI